METLELGFTQDQRDALEKLLFMQRSEEVNIFSIDRLMNCVSPGFIKKVGSLEALPGHEGYCLAGEILLEVFKPLDRVREVDLVDFGVEGD